MGAISERVEKFGISESLFMTSPALLLFAPFSVALEDLGVFRLLPREQFVEVRFVERDQLASAHIDPHDLTSNQR